MVSSVDLLFLQLSPPARLVMTLERFTKPCWSSFYTGNVMPSWRWCRTSVRLSSWIRNQFLCQRCYFLFQLFYAFFVFRRLHLHPLVLVLETISAALCTFNISKPLLFKSVCSIRWAFRWILAVLFRFWAWWAAGTSHFCGVSGLKNR